jgi:hypothetical protein
MYVHHVMYVVMEREWKVQHRKQVRISSDKLNF